MGNARLERIAKIRKAQKDGPAIPREVILGAIADALDAFDQWTKPITKGEGINVGYVHFAFGYMHRAEALIELLEIQDCGSTGGYDKGQEDNYTLQDRLNWLQGKYRRK